jgi:uncharacterized protein (TIGR02678 family)
MISALSATLAATERQERRAALRHLIRHPLVSGERDQDAFALVVRHRRWLTEWFADRVGWTLVVDFAAGFARLHKVPARSDGSRPARVASTKPAFTKRRYALLCLTLAALDDGAAQTTLATLAEFVEQMSREGQEIEPFDPTLFSERRAFVDALKWLASAGVLVVREGDAERYATTGNADALYDVNDHLLAQLLSAPVPPTLAGDRARMVQEPYAETEDGQRQRARHGVLRRLLDDPVVYLDELSPAQREWLEPSRGFVYRLLEDDVGLKVERRAEGLAAVDPEGEVTDVLFPDGGSTVKHMALLLGEKLVDRARRAAPRDTVESDAEVATIAQRLIDSYGTRCGWKKEYLADDRGAMQLTEDALSLLSSFGLVRRAAEGWQPLPALARFAPMAPEADSNPWGIT